MDKEVSQTESEQQQEEVSVTAENEEMYYTMTDDGSEKNDEKLELNNSGLIQNKRIMIGRLTGRQEIRLNMKLSEVVEGPKVELHMSIGALTLFVSPRQLHLLILLCDILLNGNGEQLASDNRSELQSRQLQHEIEMENNSRKMFTPGGILANQAWSSADPNDDFRFNRNDFTAADLRCINTLHPVGSDSIFSSNSSMSSSIGSSASQGTSKRKRAIEKDMNADISHFSIRLAGLYMILMHDDYLIETSSVGPQPEAPLNLASVDKLIYKSEHFFDYISSEINTCSTSDLIKIGSILSNACDNTNHLR